jgi:hypothetical protein
LVLSGGLDSVTPASWARESAQRLKNSIYLEYPAVAHAVLYSSLCSNDEVQRFLNPDTQVTALCEYKERLLERSDTSLYWAY